MAHGGSRTITAYIVAAQNSKTAIKIERLGRTRVYYPNWMRLGDINQIVQEAIGSGSYDFEIEIFDNSIWITVYGL